MMQFQAHGFTHRGNQHEGGATSRRGQTSTKPGSTFSSGGGVAPPSYLDPEADPDRPRSRPDFVAETAGGRGQRGVCGEGHRRNWTLSPRCPRWRIASRCAPRRNRRATALNQTREERSGTEGVAVTLLSRTVCRRGVPRRFSSGSSAQSKNCIRATEFDVHNIP
jgi:hypothetical protein